jgi:cupin fold WbuC family metalloprotein
MWIASPRQLPATTAMRPDLSMTNVFRGDDDALVGPEWIERLKKTALSHPLHRSRLCLHHSDDDHVHEMIIALARDCVFQPHRHLSKSESYHMIDGRMALLTFTDDGMPSYAILFTPPGGGGAVCFRLSKSVYHTVLPLDEVVIFQEVTAGPFKKGEAMLAPWAPTDPKELRIFLEHAAASCGLNSTFAA